MNWMRNVLPAVLLLAPATALGQDASGLRSTGFGYCHAVDDGEHRVLQSAVFAYDGAPDRLMINWISFLKAEYPQVRDLGACRVISSSVKAAGADRAKVVAEKPVVLRSAYLDARAVDVRWTPTR